MPNSFQYDSANNIIKYSHGVIWGDGGTTDYAVITKTGSTYWVGAGGLLYASIFATDNAVATTITSAGVKVQVTIFTTNGPSQGATPDHTNDHITALIAGDYDISVSATVDSVAGAASRFEMTVQKNNGTAALGGLHCDRNLGGGASESGVISMSDIVTLAANDTVEVWIENETNTQDYVVQNITLKIIQVGG